MDQKITNILLVASGVIIIIFIALWWQSSQPGKLDDFTKCLVKKDAKFYGAFWCPHCQSQKKMFGNSRRYLPYIECSTIDGKGQLQVCRDAGVQSYPTWEFTDGSREIGEIPLNVLSEKTGCQIDG